MSEVFDSVTEEFDSPQEGEVGEVIELEAETITDYEDLKQGRPYFTAKDLADWTCLAAVSEPEDTHGNKGAENPYRKLSPPKHNTFLYFINERFDLEHKGWVYYYFWHLVVCTIQIPLHIFQWRDDNERSTRKTTLLAANFFMVVFSRTPWFKWGIYVSTLPTYYLPANTLKLFVNKLVVNNGGVHSCMAAWLLFDWSYVVGQAIYYEAVGTTRETYHFVVASASLVALCFIMLFAMPWRGGPIFHELFEFSHRYCGWGIAGLALSDVLISLLNGGDEVYELNDTGVWLILATIALVVYPWLGILQAYNVDCYLFAPSTRLVIARIPKMFFAHGGVGCRIAFSNEGLGDWHPFAVLPDLESDPAKCTMGIARAGDWTAMLIESTIEGQGDDAELDSSTPNAKLCMNRVGVPGFMWLARNYERVICIGTGAGIAPVASFLPNPPIEMMILWVGRKFEETYGPLYDFVAAYCNVILIDTTMEQSNDNPYAPTETLQVKWCKALLKRQPSICHSFTSHSKRLHRPDLPALAKAAVEMFNADAVFIVSGQEPTFQVCHELWKVGVHAYGATWDS